MLGQSPARAGVCTDEVTADCFAALTDDVPSETTDVRAKAPMRAILSNSMGFFSWRIERETRSFGRSVTVGARKSRAAVAEPNVRCGEYHLRRLHPARCATA